MFGYGFLRFNNRLTGFCISKYFHHIYALRIGDFGNILEKLGILTISG